MAWFYCYSIRDNIDFTIIIWNYLIVCFQSQFLLLQYRVLIFSLDMIKCIASGAAFLESWIKKTDNRNQFSLLSVWLMTGLFQTWVEKKIFYLIRCSSKVKESDTFWLRKAYVKVEHFKGKGSFLLTKSEVLWL